MGRDWSHGYRHGHRLEMGGEVAEEWGFKGQTHARDVGAVLPDFQDHFDNIVDVALRINAAGNGQAHEIHLRGGGEHQRTDFYGADSAFQIKLCCQGYAGELVGGNVGEEGAGIEIDGVSAGRLDNGDSLSGDVIAQVRRRGDAVAEVIFFESFLHAYCDGLEIAPSKATISRVSLGENQQIFSC